MFYRFQFLGAFLFFYLISIKFTINTNYSAIFFVISIILFMATLISFIEYTTTTKTDLILHAIKNNKNDIFFKLIKKYPNYSKIQAISKSIEVNNLDVFKYIIGKNNQYIYFITIEGINNMNNNMLKIIINDKKIIDYVESEDVFLYKKIMKLKTAKKIELF